MSSVHMEVKDIRFGGVTRATLKLEIFEDSEFYNTEEREIHVDFNTYMPAYDYKPEKLRPLSSSKPRVITNKWNAQVGLEIDYGHVEIPKFCNALIARLVFPKMKKADKKAAGIPETNQIILWLVGDKCEAGFNQFTTSGFNKVSRFYEALMRHAHEQEKKDKLDGDIEDQVRQYACTTNVLLRQLVATVAECDPRDSLVVETPTFVIKAEYEREEKEKPCINLEDFNRIFKTAKTPRAIDDVVHGVLGLLMHFKFRGKDTSKIKDPALKSLLADSPVIGASASLKECSYEESTMIIAPTPICLRSANFAIGETDQRWGNINNEFRKNDPEARKPSTFLDTIQHMAKTTYKKENKHSTVVYPSTEKFEEILNAHLLKQCAIAIPGFAVEISKIERDKSAQDAMVPAFFGSRPISRILTQPIGDGAGFVYVSDFYFEEDEEKEGAIVAKIGESWDMLDRTDDCDGNALKAAHTHREMQRIMKESEKEENAKISCPVTALMMCIYLCLEPGVAWGTVKVRGGAPGGHMWWTLQRTDAHYDMVFEFLTKKTNVLQEFQTKNTIKEITIDKFKKLADHVLLPFQDTVMCEATSQDGAMDNQRLFLNKVLQDSALFKEYKKSR